MNKSNINFNGSSVMGPIPDGVGKMANLTQSIDSFQTKLELLEKWKVSFETMIGAVLGSWFSVLFWWCPDSGHIYNNDCPLILRGKNERFLIDGL